MGYFLLVLGFLGIVASIFLLIFNFFKKRTQKKAKWILISGVILLVLGYVTVPKDEASFSENDARKSSIAASKSKAKLSSIAASKSKAKSSSIAASKSEAESSSVAVSKAEAESSSAAASKAAADAQAAAASKAAADAQAAAASKAAADAQVAATNQQTNTSGYHQDASGRWHRRDGKFASKQEILSAGLTW